jgi:pectate lyase
MAVRSTFVAGLAAFTLFAFVHAGADGLALGSARADAAESCANSAVPGTPYQGFGAKATGGAGQPVYTVTSLADPVGGSVQGTLRHAIASGNRCIVFAVSGTIDVNDTNADLRVRGGNLTIDGFTAPPPGITIRGHGLYVSGSNVSNVIIRGIRIREADQRSCDEPDCVGTGTGVGVLMTYGANTIVVDHVSVAHSGNAAISVVKGARDVTVSNSLVLQNHNLIHPEYNLLMLVSGAQTGGTGERTRRVTLHHNLVMNGSERMPQVKWSDTGEQAPEVMADMTNNLIVGWGFAANQIWKGAKANVVNNYYHHTSASDSGQKRAIYFCEERSVSPQCTPQPEMVARAYIAGNMSGAGAGVSDYLNDLGTEAVPFQAPFVWATDACTAARAVVASSGVRPLDAVDSSYLAGITLACAGTPAPVPPPPAPTPPPPPALPDLVVTSVSTPGTLTAGVDFVMKFTVANQGTGTAPTSVARIYLSRDDRRSSDDVLLRVRNPIALAPGASQVHSITEVVPTSVAAGSYHLLVVADADATVTESNENNNAMAIPVTVAAPVVAAPDLVITNVAAPTTITRGVTFILKFTVANQGTASAPASVARVFLSRDTRPSSDDAVLRVRTPSALAPGASQLHSVTEYVSPTVAAGTYYLLFQADAGATIAESNETNNVATATVTVR